MVPEEEWMMFASLLPQIVPQRILGATITALFSQFMDTIEHIHRCRGIWPSLLLAHQLIFLVAALLIHLDKIRRAKLEAGSGGMPLLMPYTGLILIHIELLIGNLA